MVKPSSKRLPRSDAVSPKFLLKVYHQFPSTLHLFGNIFKS